MHAAKVAVYFYLDHYENLLTIFIIFLYLLYLWHNFIKKQNATT